MSEYVILQKYSTISYRSDSNDARSCIVPYDMEAVIARSSVQYDEIDGDCIVYPIYGSDYMLLTDQWREWISMQPILINELKSVTPRGTLLFYAEWTTKHPSGIYTIWRSGIDLMGINRTDISIPYNSIDESIDCYNNYGTMYSRIGPEGRDEYGRMIVYVINTDQRGSVIYPGYGDETYILYASSITWTNEDEYLYRVRDIIRNHTLKSIYSSIPKQYTDIVISAAYDIEDLPSYDKASSILDKEYGSEQYDDVIEFMNKISYR